MIRHTLEIVVYAALIALMISVALGTFLPEGLADRWALGITAALCFLAWFPDRRGA